MPPNDSPDDAEARRRFCAALAEAQRHAKMVGKDGTNAFHKYAYTTAESVIEEVRICLSSFGLALSKTDSRIVESAMQGYELIGKDQVRTFRYCSLVTTWELTHKDGYSRTIGVEWPIVPEKGRPIDKAVAVADTSTISYLLRDVLCLTRKDADDDMNDDRRDSHPPPRSWRAARREPEGDTDQPADTNRIPPPDTTRNGPETPKTRTSGTDEPITLEEIAAEFDAVDRLVAAGIASEDIERRMDIWRTTRRIPRARTDVRGAILTRIFLASRRVLSDEEHDKALATLTETERAHLAALEAKIAVHRRGQYGEVAQAPKDEAKDQQADEAHAPPNRG